MSYHLNIQRSEPPALSDSEVGEKLPGVHGFQSTRQTGSCAIFHFKPEGIEEIAVYWNNGHLWAERVEDAQISFLASLAAQLGAQVVGDEGEVYSLSGAVASRPVQAEKSKPLYWIRAFLRRNSVTIVVLLLFAVAAFLMRWAEA